MFSFFNFISLFAIGLSTASLVQTRSIAQATSVEDNPTPYSGVWAVDYYELDEGCSVSTETNDGFVFYFGLDTSQGLPLLDIVVINQNWRSIEADEAYPVTVKFGDSGSWKLIMTGINVNGTTGLGLLLDADTEEAGSLINDFITESEMEVIYEENSLAILSLEHSREAFMEAIDCTVSYVQSKPLNIDPFNRSTRLEADPSAL